MNKSFRAQESLMPSIRHRVPQLRSLKEPTAKEKEDDLALFLEMRKREKEKNDLLLHNSEELDQSLVSQSGVSPLFSIPPAAPTRKTGADEFLNSENDKNDYDWLLTPPGTPLFPSLDMDSRKNYLGETEAPNCHPTALKSRLANSQPEATKRSTLVSRQQQTSSTELNSSSSGHRRPSSSGGPASRPATPSRPGSRPTTPTGRPTLTTSCRTSSRPSTPTSRPTLSSTKPAMTSSTRSTTSAKSTVVPRSSTPLRSTPTSKSTARSSTPTTSKSTVRSSTPTTSKSTARSSTPTSRSTARSSTPTSRPTTTATTVPRASSRPSTPTRRPSTPSRTTTASAAASLTKSTSLVNKAGPTAPLVRPRPWKPSEMPGFSLDAPPNLRTTLPDRPLSATRGRPPGATAPRSNSVGPTSTPGRQRRQSCSPSRGRAPNNMSGGSVPAVNRVHSSRANDDVSPVVMGNKMVERVINMRKLVPPKQDSKHSPSLSGKSASSPDNSGFGRTLSKKSLDMAIRHMDIRRTIPGNLRPLMTNIPASSMYSVRSGPARSRTVSVSDSPLATSSNASSELSVNNINAVGILDVNEMDDDRCSDRGGGAVSPTSIHGFRPFGR